MQAFAAYFGIWSEGFQKGRGDWEEFVPWTRASISDRMKNGSERNPEVFNGKEWSWLVEQGRLEIGQDLTGQSPSRRRTFQN